MTGGREGGADEWIMQTAEGAGRSYEGMSNEQRAESGRRPRRRKLSL